MEKDTNAIKKRIAKAKLNRKVDDFVPITILKFYYTFEQNWFSKADMKCCRCGRNNIGPAVLEIVSFEGSENKMDMVCSGCLFKSGYERVLGKSHWSWKKKG